MAIVKTTLLSFLFLLMVVGSSILCLAQNPATKTDEDWWFNFTSAPLIFDRPHYKSDERDLRVGLRNRSSKYVTDYDFGCIEQDGREIKISKRFWGGSITDGGYQPKSFFPPFGTKDTDKDVAYAKGLCKDSKIAVVWVVFDGGGYWAAPGVVRVKRSF
jgi:hypothetical protein